jgi:hypothetical protein
MVAILYRLEEGLLVAHNLTVVVLQSDYLPPKLLLPGVMK